MMCPCGRRYEPGALRVDANWSDDEEQVWGGIDSPLVGELLSVKERLVVSPGAGVFAPADMDGPADRVEVGTTVGTVAGDAVKSLFAGRLMGVLAHAGERVQPGQPIVWLRVDDSV